MTKRHGDDVNLKTCRRGGQVALVLTGIALSLAGIPGGPATTPRAYSSSPPSQPTLEYNRDIRPILAENCFACHGPDSAARKAELRLDDRDAAIQARAIVPGKPEASKLVARIFAENAGDRMPPRKTNKSLSDAQKETLKKWVAEGAAYQPHWSFLAIKRPELPAVKQADWVRNPIDRFVLAQLEKRGLAPAPEADRAALARRVSLDLIGLPPTAEELKAFLNDRAADAYERYVDKLLESPHWGEHRGRYWLDAARYADTHGIHFDNYREIWTYRDWVIAAFNKNMPFDQFTVEQLAGDLLPRPTLEQLIATGFNRCNITTNEGGAINEEYLVLYARDRTETVAQVWLGLTAGCAVCHDHKFDPMNQKEFYQLSAFFNNTTQAAMDGNIKDTPPVIPVPRPEDRPRWDALAKELGEVRQKIDARRREAGPDFDRWLAQARPARLQAAIPREHLKLHALLGDGATQSVNVAVDGQQQLIPVEKPLSWQPGHIAALALKFRPNASIELDDAGDFERDQPFSFGAWLRLPNNNVTGAAFARMDEQAGHRGWDLWIENNRVGVHLIHKFPEDAVKVVFPAPLKANEWTHVFVTYDGSSKAAGIRVYINGVSQAGGQVTQNSLKNTIRTGVPLKIGQRHKSATIADLGIQDVRLYAAALEAADVARIARGSRAAWLAGKPADKRSDAEKSELLDYWLHAHDQAFRDALAKRDELEKEEAAIKARGSVAHIMQEKPGEPTAHVLFRGDYDKRRDEVKAGTPLFLPPMPDDLPRNRLGFARWLLRPEHPLTARVTVNRFWQEVFGTGIVRTSGDFGISGELPSHPELLDWLAVEFRESGWDVKKFFKLIVTSATYRQSAVVTREKLEKDPQNRWLSRGPRFRMDAEMLRDYALAASGLLVRKIGGPSVKPYQPDGVWEAVAMIGSNTRDYRRDSGENLYRRSLYTFWKRSAPPAAMEIFNAPNRETCTVRRERTNTPLQALVTLNDPQFVEAARQLAQHALHKAGDKFDDRLDFMVQCVLARSFRPEESKVVKETYKFLLDHYRAQPDEARKLIAVGESRPDPNLDAAELAAWTLVANQLFNLDEALNK